MVFSLTGPGTIGYPLGGKMKLNLNFTPHAKINFRWIIDLKVKSKTIKLLEDNIEDYLQDLRVKEFLDNTQKTLTIKRNDGYI